MLKSVALAGVFTVALALPSFAQDSCSEPIPPAPINGSAANEKQVNDATKDAKMFLKQSADYQECLMQDLRVQAAAAQHNKKQLDPSVAGEIQAKIDANQKLKERVGTELNTAVYQFCQAHAQIAGCDKVLNPPVARTTP
jgi:hypothetical protein